MQRSGSWSFLFAVLVALSGCAGNVRLSEDAANTVKTISVSRDVDFEESPIFMNHTRSMGAALAGVVGYGVAVAATSRVQDESPQALTAYMKQYNIPLQDLVRSEFDSLVFTHPSFIGKRAEKGDAEFRLKVRWGMGQRTFSAEYRPFLFVFAELVRNNEVIWRSKASVSPMSDKVGGRTWSELTSTPGALRTMYTDAARYVIGEILKQLDGQSES